MEVLVSDSLDQLDSLRAQIDIEDKKILESLSTRFKLCAQIGGVKKKNNMPLHQNTRCESLLSERLELGKQLGLDPDFVRTFYNMIHDLSKDIQQKTLSEVSDE